MLGAAQSVYGFIKLILDHPAFPDGQGRFVNDRFIDQLINILQAVNLLPDFRQFFFSKADSTVLIGGSICREFRNAIRSLGFAVL